MLIQVVIQWGWSKTAKHVSIVSHKSIIYLNLSSKLLEVMDKGGKRGYLVLEQTRKEEQAIFTFHFHPQIHNNTHCFSWSLTNTVIVDTAWSSCTWIVFHNILLSYIQFMAINSLPLTGSSQKHGLGGCARNNNQGFILCHGKSNPATWNTQVLQIS